MSPLAFAVHAAAAERAAALDPKERAAARREQREIDRCRRTVAAALSYPPEEAH